MALIVKDRVQEISTTVGTGTLTLGGAVLGFQSFAAIGDGNTTYYAISDPVTGDWEVGIGTYTSSGTTLSRDTVLSSSTGASPVSFVAGTKNVFCTYPSERSVYRDALATYTVQQAFDAITANSIALTSGTISSDPVNATDIANKSYVDEVAEGLRAKPSVELATTANLTANYNNGTSGVGATLTATTNGAFPMIDGITLTSTTPGQNGVLVKNQSSALQNGRYNLTTLGDGSNPWVLTRCPLCDESDEIPGAYTFVKSGTLNGGTGWVQTVLDPSTFTIGVDAIIVVQFSGAGTYTAGTGLTLTSNVFSITNTAVTPASYGTASSVGTFTVNAQGQLTNAVDTPIAIGAAAVSGLAASATTDTTNASNITSGTLGTSRLSGSYTGITGVGALAAGSLATGFTAVSAPLGGTGQTSYTVGDILFASTSTALSKLAGVAVGNALISGGVGSAPSYGKIGLATHVSGTLPTASGGTNLTSFTANGVVYASSTSALATGSDFAFDGNTVLIPAGSVSVPSLAFSTDANTGIYLSATDQLAITTGGTQAAYFDASGNTNIVGNLGVKSATPSASAAVNSSITLGPNATRYGINNLTTIDNTATLTADRSTYGAYNLVESQVQNSAAFSHIAYGSYNYARTSTAGGNSVNGEGALYGSFNYALHQTDDATYTRLENAFGSYNNAQASGDTALINQAYGVYSIVRPTVAGATVGTGYLFYGTNSTVTGTFTNRWGVYIASSINNYFAGGAQVGGTATGSTSAAGLGVGTAPTGAGNINGTGNLVMAGNVTAYSDARLKENVNTITNALELVSKMRGVSYTRKDTGDRQVGVIAQELQDVLPEVVQENEQYLSVAYGNIVSVLIEAIKEIKLELDELKRQ